MKSVAGKVIVEHLVQLHDRQDVKASSAMGHPTQERQSHPGPGATGGMAMDIGEGFLQMRIDE